MNTETEDQKVDLTPPGSYSERRKMREALGDLKGTNVYGGDRCKCPDCGDVHWKRATNPTEQKET
jgi:hypothetical protein